MNMDAAGLQTPQIQKAQIFLHRIVSSVWRDEPLAEVSYLNQLMARILDFKKMTLNKTGNVLTT
jgi:hypothetical protein